jgi:hypothetical protein
MSSTESLLNQNKLIEEKHTLTKIMKNNKKIRKDLENALQTLLNEKNELEEEFLYFTDKNLNKRKLQKACKYLAKEKLNLFN